MTEAERDAQLKLLLFDLELKRASTNWVTPGPVRLNFKKVAWL